MEEAHGVKELTYDQYKDIFENKILPDTSCIGVQNAMQQYITSVIEPVGWKAIWRKSFDQSDVPHPGANSLVEVLDVSLTELEAEVRCIKHYVGENDEDTSMTTYVAPLLQLHPTISQDPNLNLGPTIEALNVLRFFYDNLWRPWDTEFNGEVDIFVDKYLEIRLQLYFDAVTNNIPEATLNKIGALISEGQTLVDKLDNLRNEMKASEVNSELDEHDVLKCMELTMRLEAVQKEVEMLENPLLRNLMKKQELQILSPKQNLKRKSLCSDKVVTHLVGESINVAMIKRLDLPDSEIIQIHDSFVNAVNECNNEDKILLFPGCYNCEGLPWFEIDLNIIGIGEASEIILDSTAEAVGDIFINCSSKSINISNLVIQVSSGAMSNLVAVHKGRLTFNNVVLKVLRSSRVNCGINVLSNAHFFANNLAVENCEVAGINMSEKAKCEIMKSDISKCQFGIYVRNSCLLQIKHCSMKDILKYGIAIQQANGSEIIETNIENVESLRRESSAEIFIEDTGDMLCGITLYGKICDFQPKDITPKLEFDSEGEI